MLFALLKFSVLRKKKSYCCSVSLDDKDLRFLCNCFLVVMKSPMCLLAVCTSVLARSCCLSRWHPPSKFDTEPTQLFCQEPAVVAHVVYYTVYICCVYIQQGETWPTASQKGLFVMSRTREAQTSLLSRFSVNGQIPFLFLKENVVFCFIDCDAATLHLLFHRQCVCTKLVEVELLSLLSLV